MLERLWNVVLAEVVVERNVFRAEVVVLAMFNVVDTRIRRIGVGEVKVGKLTKVPGPTFYLLSGVNKEISRDQSVTWFIYIHQPLYNVFDKVISLYCFSCFSSLLKYKLIQGVRELL